MIYEVNNFILSDKKKNIHTRQDYCLIKRCQLYKLFKFQFPTEFKIEHMHIVVVIYLIALVTF